MKPRTFVHAYPAEKDNLGSLPPQICVAVMVPVAGDLPANGQIYSLTLDEAKALRDALTGEIEAIEGPRQLTIDMAAPILAAAPRKVEAGREHHEDGSVVVLYTDGSYEEHPDRSTLPALPVGPQS